MRLLGVTTVVLLSVIGLGGSLIRAEDHNADIGGGGLLGLPSAWDSESVVLPGSVWVEVT